MNVITEIETKDIPEEPLGWLRAEALRLGIPLRELIRRIVLEKAEQIAAAA